MAIRGSLKVDGLRSAYQVQSNGGQNFQIASAKKPGKPALTQSAFPVVASAGDDSKKYRATMDDIVLSLSGLIKVNDVAYAGIQVNIYEKQPIDFTVELILNYAPVDNSGTTTNAFDVFALKIQMLVESAIRNNTLIDDVSVFLKRVNLIIRVLDGTNRDRRKLLEAFKSRDAFKKVIVNIPRSHPKFELRKSIIQNKSEGAVDSYTRFFPKNVDTAGLSEEGRKLVSEIVDYLESSFISPSYKLVFELHANKGNEISTKLRAQRVADAFKREFAERGIDTSEIEWETVGLGSGRFIVPEKGADSYRNNYTRIKLIGTSRVARIKEVSDVAVAAPAKEPESKKGNFSSPLSEKNVMEKKPSQSETTEPRRWFLSGRIGGRFGILWGNTGVENLYAPGAVFEFGAVWTPITRGAHEISFGTGLGFGIGFPVGDAYGCYPQNISGDTASGCKPGEPNMRIQLAHVFNLEPDINFTYAYNTSYAGMKFYLSLLLSYQWDSFKVKIDKDAKITSPDIADAGGGFEQHHIKLGAEAGLLWPLSESYQGKLGGFIRGSGMVFSKYHNDEADPASLHMQLKNSSPVIDAGLVGWF